MASNSEVPSSLSKHEHIMSEMDDIIEHVLKWLPMKSLQSSARVCHKWNTAVQRIKKFRKQLAWLLYDQEENERVEETLEVDLKNVSSEPHTALLFCSSELHDDQKISVSSPNAHVHLTSRLCKRRKMEVGSYMQGQLPRKCDLYGVAASGIIGSSRDLSQTSELEESAALSCLLLPKLPNLELYSFYGGYDLEERLDPVVVCARTRCPDAAKLAAVTGIPADKHPKLVLLFYTREFVYIETDIGAALLKHYKNLVIGGAYVDDLLLPDAESRTVEPSFHGLAFCGKDIKLASVLLKNDVKTTEDAEKCLSKLKAAHIPEVNRLGFMFSCIARGENHYEARNVESKIFRKMFPKTPLLGLFGNGEVGYEYLPDYSKPEGDSNMNLIGEYMHNEDDEDDMDIPADIPDMYHSYSTVFVLMSLGDMKHTPTVAKS